MQLTTKTTDKENFRLQVRAYSLFIQFVKNK